MTRFHVLRPQDMQRPLYMRPLDAIEYGVIDRLVPPQKELEIIDQVRHLSTRRSLV